MAAFEETSQMLHLQMRSYWIFTPVEYENAGEFTPPREQPWVRFRIYEEPSEQQGMGMTNLTRNWGRVVVQVFIPVYRGPDAGRQLASLVAQVFSRQVIGAQPVGKIQCRTASVEAIGKSEAWYQHNVTVPFYRTTIGT